MKKNKNNSPKEGNNHSPDGEKKKGSGKLLFWGLGALAIGALSFFGWNYWKDHSATKTNEDEKEFDPESIKTDSTHNSEVKHSSPSKTSHASQGNKKTNHAKGTQNTHQNSQPEINTAHEEKLDAANVAMQLVKTATLKQYLKTVTLLNLLKNASDYNAVNSVFKTYRVKGIHQTLVNALLSTFTDARQKLIIKAEFLRIGLKHNVQTDKWTLSGTNSRTLITVSSTKVWKSPKHSVSVPHHIVLSQEVAQRGQHTLFENEHVYYLVPSAHIKYHRS